MSYTTPHIHLITLFLPPTPFHSPDNFHRPTTTHAAFFGVKTKQVSKWRSFSQRGGHHRAPALSPLPSIKGHLLPPSSSQTHSRKHLHTSVLGFQTKCSGSEERRRVEWKERVEESLIVFEIGE
jgi:hypothetical protein